MKTQWIVLVLGLGLYILALIPGAPPHRLDLIAMIISGMLIASLAILGFDLPYQHKKLGAVFLGSGILVLLGGITMAIIGHAYALFVVAVPALGLALLGLRELRSKKNE